MLNATQQRRVDKAVALAHRTLKTSEKAAELQRSTKH